LNDDLYIWVTRWDDFQTFQKKRGKPWAPPWIRNYIAQLSDDRYLDLTDRQRALLHDLRMVFAMTKGRTRYDHRTISSFRRRRTRYADLEALNHAGFIEFCSGTVLEQKRAAFWNSSGLEVEVEVEEKNPPNPTRSKTTGDGWVGIQNGETPEPLYGDLLRDMPK
jgi:hypothetical protein